MKRLILPLLLALLTPCLALAQEPSGLIKIAGVGKSMEGGIAVNPVTHKAYVLAELATEGSDDAKTIFVIDDDVLTLGVAAHPPKEIPIPNENEYVTIDTTRNLIYVATKIPGEESESDSGGDAGEAEVPGQVEPPSNPQVPVGTLTVIDGETDTVIATYYFAPGVEPEQVAVDTANGVVYVAAKAPEGESPTNDSCISGTPIPDVGEPADVECWTGGYIYAFFVDRAADPIIKYLRTIPAGDDPESLVFINGMVYAANEDDGTVTIASAVLPDGSGGELLTDLPIPPTQPYALGVAPYSLGVFYNYGPNPLACIENKFEADKMAAGGGSVFLTDDRSRVAKIVGTTVAGMWEVPGATVCEEIPNSDGGGANSANNIAYMLREAGNRQFLYVVSEQNTVAVYDPTTMKQKGTITIPDARHLDGIAVDGVARRVWLTDEELQLIFVLQGDCAFGSGECTSTVPQDNTTNTLSVGPNPAGAGQAINFAAKIETAGTHPPIGNVAFYDHGISFGTGTLDASGVASDTTSQLLPGTHNIIAVYGGDTYNAASTSAQVNLTIAELAAMLSPVNGSNIPAGPPVTFTWSLPAGVTTTYLWVGTALGANDLVNFGGASATSFTQGNLPVGTIYVRLWSSINGEMQYRDYTYKAAATELAAITSPANGSTLAAGLPVTFIWNSPTGVATTYLWVGSTLGANDLVNFGGGSATSFVVNNLPAGPIYVRLWSKIGEQLQYRDYAYTAEAPVPARMTSPTNGALITNPVTFTWSSGGPYVTTTFLWVGSAPGGNDLANFGGGSATSFAVNLPAGSIYVRLWSLIGSQLQYQEYAYTVE